MAVSGLDSLASAAQLATGCHEDPTALLTPRMLALVAPYYMGGTGQWMQKQHDGSEIAAASFCQPTSLWGLKDASQPHLRLPPPPQAAVLTAKRASTADELGNRISSSMENDAAASGWGRAPPPKRVQGLPFVMSLDNVSNSLLLPCCFSLTFTMTRPNVSLTTVCLFQEGLVSSSEARPPWLHGDKCAQNGDAIANAELAREQSHHPHASVIFGREGLWQSSLSAGAIDSAREASTCTVVSSGMVPTIAQSSSPSSASVDQQQGCMFSIKGGPVMQHLFRLHKEKKAAEALSQQDCSSESQKACSFSAQPPFPATPSLDEATTSSMLIQPWDIKRHDSVSSSAGTGDQQQIQLPCS